MTTLIVTLATTLPGTATLCDGVVTADGHTVLSHATAALPLLPAAAGAEVVALVPTACLSWHLAALPKGSLNTGFLQDGNPQKLRAVLDGLLEDRVLDEPAQLHFAIAPQTAPQASTSAAGAPVWVAACDRAWLKAWLAALEAAGQHVTRIVPETTPVPDSPSLHVIGTAEKALLVLSSTVGVVTLPLNAATVALLPADAHPWPVLAEPAVAALAERHWPGRVLLQTRHQRAVVAAQSAWDLAQFDLLRTRRARTTKRLSATASALLRGPRWRAARWAAGLLLLVNVVGLQAWAWKEQSAQAAQRAAIRDTLTTTFPEVRVVVDAPLQMARALADLQRQSGAPTGTDLETMLAQIQPLALVKYSPTAIEFVANELRLSGWAAPGGPTPGDLPGLNARLQAQGYSARLEGESLVLKQARQP